MHKFIYISFSIFITLTVLFVSCTKSTDWNDNGIPYITDIRINVEDTILIPIANQSGKYETIYINRDKVEDATIDTVILGHLLNLTSRFRDDKELSSFGLDIRMTGGQSAIENEIDTILQMRKGYTLYGKSPTDTLVEKQNLFQIPDTILSNKGKRLPVREGDYSLMVRCADVAGNESDSTKNGNIITVRLLNRKTIIENLDRK